MKATRPRYGRRTNLEARRLLGVEAQDAGLLLRPPACALAVRAGRLRCWSRATPRRDDAIASARDSAWLWTQRTRRALALLQGAAARASLPAQWALRRVGLVSGHHCGTFATSYAIGASTGQRACSTGVSRREQHASRSDLVRLCTTSRAARGVSASPPACADAVDCKEETHIAEALRTWLQRRGGHS